MTRAEVIAFILAFGKPGPTGDEGPQGPEGDEGPQGIPGPTGDDGKDGSQGIPGPVGPKGPKGDTGPQGRVGPEGPKGERGEDGERGPKGDLGRPWIRLGSGGGGGSGGTTDHALLTNVTSDQHHARDHALSGATHTGTLSDAQIPATVARDTEVATAVSDHSNDTTNVHGFTDTSDAATADDIETAVQAHEAAVDPHPGYLTPTEGNAAYAPLAASSALAHIKWSLD